MSWSAEVVERLWTSLQARDWETATSCLHEDFVAEWPHSRERFRGREAYIAMQRAYPEGWSIRVLRLVAQEELVAAEVEVLHGEQVFFCAAFATVEGERVRRATEYWVTAGSEERPEWRRRFSEVS